MSRGLQSMRVLLRVRENREQKQESILAERAARVGAAAQQVQGARRLLVAHCDPGTEAGSVLMQGADVCAWHAERERLRRVCVDAEKALLQAQAERERGAAEYRAARCEREAVGSLVEQRAGAEVQRLAKFDMQRVADAMASRRHVQE